MAQLLVPDDGLTLIDQIQPKLQDAASKAASKSNSGLAQVMQLDLPPHLLGDILKGARHGGKGLNVQFGKTIVSGLLNNY